MSDRRPNLLIITCDQYRFPRFSYGESGFDEPLKRVLGFASDLGEDNPYTKFFPGLMRLRRNGVLLKNHTIAASACTPSRATIYTGQYGTRTGVTQTDGLFKNENAPNFPWLAEDGIPTLGVWMREAGYTTHYFGKWHVSNPPDHSLQKYGFDNWEESYPEPHGALSNNLGLYRDVGFANAAVSFIKRQGLGINYARAVSEADLRDPNGPSPSGDDKPPWLAVVSFTNPHDIATYPGVISQALPQPNVEPPAAQSPMGPLTVPLAGDRSLPPTAGTTRLRLNPLDFPQGCATLPPGWDEDLSTKPACQREYSYKVGLGLASKLGYNVASAVAAQKGQDLPVDLAVGVAATLQSDIPFPLSADPSDSCLKFIQLYGWLHAVVDPHINAVLQALEDSGQQGDTLVIFLADHGEYAAAHGMLIEKWHTAYQEALHVPVVFQLNTLPSQEFTTRDALTSHIDLLPTVLALAGVTGDARREIQQRIEAKRGHALPPLPGADLSGVIFDGEEVVTEPDGQPREGVLFITDDEITAPLPPEQSPYNQHSEAEYALYCAVVDAVIHGTPKKGPVQMTRGAVCQPNHVRAVRTRDYKLVRTFDPSGEVAQQWELYDLRWDPNEFSNLTDLNSTPPAPAPALPEWTSTPEVTEALQALSALLEKLERRDLSWPVDQEQATSLG